MFIHSKLYSPEGDGTSGGGAGGAQTSTLLNTSQGADTSAATSTKTAAEIAAETQSTATAPDFLSSKYSDWEKNLPDDLKDYGSLKKYPNAVEMLRAHRELEKTLSTRAVVKPPAADAKPEEMAAWRKITGAPDTPEGYGLKAPEKLPDGVEWNADVANGFAALAHKHGLPPAAVQEIVDFNNANLSKMVAGAEAKQAEQSQAAAIELRKEWGDQFTAKVHDAASMAKLMGIDINDPKYGNDPKLTRGFAEMAKHFAGDKKLIGQEPSVVQSAQARLTALQNSPEYQGKVPVSVEKQLAIQEEIRKLHSLVGSR